MDGLEEVGGSEDIWLSVGWLGFFFCVIGASIFDACFFTEKVTQSTAGPLGDTSTATAESGESKRNKRVICCQIVFWLLVGVGFCAFVWLLFGDMVAVGWAYGYLLEYLLSVDNLFVFRVIFLAYSTPTKQVGRALLWGVAIAVVLRIVFFFVGAELLALGLIPRIIFAGALVISGIKTMFRSDKEEDPKECFCIRFLARHLPFHDGYADEPWFVMRVSSACIDTQGATTVTSGPSGQTIGASLQQVTDDKASFLDDHIHQHSTNLPSREDSEHREDDDTASVSGVVLETSLENGNECAVDAAHSKWKLTLLFLVVLTIAIVDIVFAVDSVTAKVSSVKVSKNLSLFVNLSSSALAMFVLRSIYYVLDTLVRLFRFLDYGVGIILVLIGVELITSYLFGSFGMLESAGVIIFILGSAIIASVILPRKRTGGDSEGSKTAQVESNIVVDEEARP